METVDTINCLSVDHRSAPASIRGLIAFDGERKRGLLGELGAEGAAVCTCCRTEVYACCGEEKILRLMAKYGGMSAEELKGYVRVYKGKAALRHLFRVCGGLCSAALGEDEILRQVREDYFFARDMGAAGPVLNRCFQAAVTCGKRIRTDTDISRLAVSHSTLAATEAARYGSRVLVIGASGETGRAVIRSLLTHRGVRVTAALRSHGYDVLLPEAVERVSFSDRYEALKNADAVISATKSPHYTLTLHELRSRGVSGKKLFIDLAVPADIDEAIGREPGFERMGIDDFEQIAVRHRAARELSAEAAEMIAAQDLEELLKELAYGDFLPLERPVTERLRAEPERVIRRLKKELGYEEFRAVLKVLSEVG